MTQRIDGASKQVLPDGLYSTCEPSLNALAKAAGDGFDSWQRQINRIALCMGADGMWSARNVVMSIPRQTGKTYDVGWIAIHRAARNPGTRIVWTAQHFSVIKDTFESMCAIVLRPEMTSLVDPNHGISLAAGKEEIRFRNGSRIFFRARERGALRGIKKIALLVIDEAQHLSDSAMASMLPTQNRAWNPQTIYMGTPPGPRDNGEAFTRMRDKARNGRSHSTLYVEFAAERGCDPLDRDQWRKANPSYPSHTSDESIVNLWENLSADDFRREALGIWDEHSTSRAIDMKQWEDTTVSKMRPDGIRSFGLDMNPTRTRLTIGACMRYEDGTAHIEIAEYRDTNRDGTMWAVHLIDRVWDQTASVVIDGQSPAAALLPDFAEAGVKVTVTGATDMGRACGRFQDMLRDNTLTHLGEDGQQPLWDAVRKATSRPIGKSGMIGWNRPDDDTDISPLNAVTLALHGAMTTKRDPTREQKAWY
ncbi:phage terminase large subunit [Bifidobacterium biavatii]|uniref:Terminase n=1 Tax=Bifidobacterium biavatii DSM 23969 TaxID=1437608 RepID=A0A086ZU23_9BIFI|nr:phage terminase large subunit [Bifidobacterium biavatii]KFI50023.1 terminase [Bifidobacterium biavatii DSM 23969]